MSQMRWFKKLSTVILIILAHYYDFALGRRACCTHFCITDDLEKSNEMITYCIDVVREYYDRLNAASTPPQPPNSHLFLGSDNAASQAKNNYHFSWMIEYVEEDHGLETIQKNFAAEQHGKVLVSFIKSRLLLRLCHSIHLWFYCSHFCLIRSMGCRGRGLKNGCRECCCPQL